MEELPLQPMKSFMFGIGVGAALPTADWRNVSKDGLDLRAQVGFFPGAGPLGLRLDGDYVMFGARELDCPQCPSTKLLSGSANIVLRFPLDRKSTVNPMIYFLGGGGIDKFTDFTPYRTTTRPVKIVTAGADTYRTKPGLTLTAAQAGDKSTFYHWDAGAGVSLGRFFVEAKYHSINTLGANSAYVPIVLGLNF